MISRFFSNRFDDLPVLGPMAPAADHDDRPTPTPFRLIARRMVHMQNVVSFHVLFQCRRYQGAVDALELRDFRDATVGRTDKGLFLTTGTFSREAQKEATRAGAPPITLIDGERLLDLMKELSLGVRTTIRTIKDVTVDTGWLDAI